MPVRRLAAVSLAVVLSLAGCSDEPEPRFEDPQSSPSPTESSTTSAAAERQTAEEFIREWFRAGTEMQNTGETATFLGLSPDCAPCRKFARQVEQVYAEGGFIKIKAERVVRIKELPGRPPSRPEFLVDVDSTPTTFKESESSRLDSFPGGLNQFQVFLRQQDAGWVLTDYLDRS